MCYKWVWLIDWIKYVTTKCNNYFRSYNFIDFPSLPKALCIFLGTGPIDQRFHWENTHWDSFQTLIDAYVIVSIYSDIMLCCLTVWYDVMLFHMPHSDMFPCHTLFCAREFCCKTCLWHPLTHIFMFPIVVCVYNYNM